MAHATVSDGTKIYYESHGDESLPTLVLIRGTGADGTRWMPQVNAYRSEIRCVIFDGRGVGRSETTPPPYTVESMAGDTFDLMDALGIDCGAPLRARRWAAPSACAWPPTPPSGCCRCRCTPPGWAPTASASSPWGC